MSTGVLLSSCPVSTEYPLTSLINCPSASLCVCQPVGLPVCLAFLYYSRATGGQGATGPRRLAGGGVTVVLDCCNVTGPHPGRFWKSLPAVRGNHNKSTCEPLISLTLLVTPLSPLGRVGRPCLSLCPSCRVTANTPSCKKGKDHWPFVGYFCWSEFGIRVRVALPRLLLSRPLAVWGPRDTGSNKQFTNTDTSD